jgi:hypothetical protein
VRQQLLAESQKNKSNNECYMVARFFFTKYTNRGKIYQIATKLPNGQEISKPNDLNDLLAKKMYQHFPFQCPPKFTQIGIFGLTIYRLATLECYRNIQMIVENNCEATW